MAGPLAALVKNARPLKTQPPLRVKPVPLRRALI